MYYRPDSWFQLSGSYICSPVRQLNGGYALDFEERNEEMKAEARKERNKKEFRWLKQIILVLAAMALTAVLTAGVMIRLYGGRNIMPYVSKFGVLMQGVEKYYIGEADLDAAAEAAYHTLVASTTDRWSYYMTAEETKAYSDYSKNQYPGIGVTVETDPEAEYMLTISAVNKDSPAEHGGLQVGDVFLSADGQDCAGMTINELKAIIQTHVDQELAITVNRGGEAVEVTVFCVTIQTEPVSYALLEDGVGYIKVENFEDGSADGFINAAEELLEEQDASALVFDMRGNPGGQLTELLEMLDYLLPECEMFVSVDREGKEKVYTSDKDCVTVPMAVLIDGDSYSAAEFFAAALWEYELAVTVGQPTSGKGRSQTTLFFSDGSALHISNKRYLTPKRVDLSEEGGLQPDVPAALTAEEAVQFASGHLAYAADPQLQAAVDAVKK